MTLNTCICNKDTVDTSESPSINNFFREPHHLILNFPVMFYDMVISIPEKRSSMVNLIWQRN